MVNGDDRMNCCDSSIITKSSGVDLLIESEKNKAISKATAIMAKNGAMQAIKYMC